MSKTFDYLEKFRLIFNNISSSEVDKTKLKDALDTVQKSSSSHSFNVSSFNVDGKSLIKELRKSFLKSSRPFFFRVFTQLFFFFLSTILFMFFYLTILRFVSFDWKKAERYILGDD